MTAGLKFRRRLEVQGVADGIESTAYLQNCMYFESCTFNLHVFLRLSFQIA